MEFTVYACGECVICMDAPTWQIFMPCGHQCTCTDCAAQVTQANMPCPMCRKSIQTSRPVEQVKADTARADVNREEYDTFMVRRPDYLKKLRARCNKNAGYTGKGKLSRSVASAIGDAMEEAEMMTAATQRMMAGKKVEFELEDNHTLHVTYKNKGKRKPFKESFAYADKDTVVQDVTGSDRWSTLDLAMYHPRYYWLIHYHWSGQVEDGMKELNIAQETKRRRRG